MYLHFYGCLRGLKAVRGIFVVGALVLAVGLWGLAATAHAYNATYILGQSGWTTNASGTAQNQFWQPTGLAYDPSTQRLFVSDYANNRVLVFDMSSNFLNNENAINVLGQPNFSTVTGTTTQSGFRNPQGLAFDPATNRLFVGDYSNARVMIFNVATSTIANGENALNVLGQPNFTTSVGTTTQHGTFYDLGVSLDSANQRLFVSDSPNNRVMIFNVATSTIANGENASSVLGQATYTASGQNATQNGLSNPFGSFFDAQNQRLFVSDYLSGRVMVFNVATSTLTSGENASSVIGKPNFTNNTPAISQSSTYGPWGSFWDATGTRLFVSDSAGNRLLVFPLTSSTVTTGGMNASSEIGQANFNANTAGLSQSTLHGPDGIYYDWPNHRLFVADTQNNRVLVYLFASLIPSTFPTGTVGTPYAAAFNAGGNQGVFSVATTSGSLPPGLSIINGAVSGTPTLAGNYTFTVVGTDNNGATSTFTTDPVSYSMQINGPQATLSVATSTSLSYTMFYPSPATSTQSVLITNTGAASSTLNWSATSTQSWLTFSASSGSLAQNATTTLGLIVNPVGLTPLQTYYATATISDASASGSPVSLPVALTITEDHFSVSPTSFATTTLYTQSGNIATTSVVLTNNNSSTFSWTASSTQSWLTLSSASGTLSPGASTTLMFTFNQNGLALNDYTGFVTINDGMVTFNLSANLSVVAPAVMFVSTSTPMDFSATQGDTSATGATFNVAIRQETSTTRFNWSASADASWLTFTPATGTLADGAQIAVLATPNPTGLAAGAYTSTITIVANGYGTVTNSPGTIPVTFTIAAASATHNTNVAPASVGVAASYAPSVPSVVPSHPAVSNVVTTTSPSVPSAEPTSSVSNDISIGSVPTVIAPQNSAVPAAVPQAVCISAVAAFHPTSTIWPGVVAQEVINLQKVLNAAGFPVAMTGPGSAGNETDYFGLRTIAAVEKFQAEHHIVSSGNPLSTGFGLVGPETRAALESANKICE